MTFMFYNRSRDELHVVPVNELHMDSDVIILEDEDETQEEVQHGKDRSQSSDDEEEEDSNKSEYVFRG